MSQLSQGEEGNCTASSANVDFDPSEFEGFFVTENLDLTVTSRCNLRCVYCAVSQESYKGTDIDVVMIEPLLLEMKKYGLARAQISGHGETTIIPDWEKIAYKFKANGIWTSIISNFSRSFTDDEVFALAALDYITVSLDTMDKKLLREIRRHADVSMILYNMTRVKARALMEGLPQPTFRWNCVLNDRFIGKLREWAASGIAAGVSQFTLSNMIVYPAPSGTIPLRHPGALEPGEALLLLKEIVEVKQMVVQAGRSIDYQHGLIDALEARAFGQGRVDSSAEKGGISSGEARLKFSRLPEAGQTRMCTEPWTNFRIHSDGTVWPCCFYDNDAIGTYRSEGDVEKIMVSDKVRSIRRGLLLGGEHLDPQCAHCSEKSVTSCKQLRERVAILKQNVTAAEA